MRYLVPALLTCCLLLTGCYQARMTTGQEASNTVVEERWAPSFFYGLVPARVDVSDECTNGIATAERKMTFLNMLVSGLTLSIYSPQSVTVTCAAGGSMSAYASPSGLTLPASATADDARSVLQTAAAQSFLTQETVRVHVRAE